MIRVLIADDHPIVRAGFKRCLEVEGDITVVGEAANGKEAIDLVEKCSPDVVLIDIAMPVMDGFEATKRLLRKKNRPYQVLILSMYADEHYAARLLRMGAMGYIVKDATVSQLGEAVRAVHEGRRFIAPVIRDVLAARYLDGVTSDPHDILSDREFQILRRLAEGATNREIAVELSVSVKTIDAHRLNILSKLNLRNNAALTKYAIQQGIIQV